jgi:hypothetical protein
LGPLFDRFFILGGHGGIQQKKSKSFFARQTENISAIATGVKYEHKK